MVKLLVFPEHPLEVGVTVMVAVIGEVVLFNATNEAMFPLPDEAKPIEGVLLVQAKVVPATGPEKATAAVFAAVQTI